MKGPGLVSQGRKDCSSVGEMQNQDVEEMKKNRFAIREAFI